MQKNLALFAAILIGAAASFSFAAETHSMGSKASEVKNASNPQQIIPSAVKKETSEAFTPRQTRVIPRDTGNSHGGMHGMSH